MEGITGHGQLGSPDMPNVANQAEIKKVKSEIAGLKANLEALEKDRSKFYDKFALSAKISKLELRLNGLMGKSEKDGSVLSQEHKNLVRYQRQGIRLRMDVDDEIAGLKVLDFRGKKPLKAQRKIVSKQLKAMEAYETNLLAVHGLRIDLHDKVQRDMNQLSAASSRDSSTGELEDTASSEDISSASPNVARVTRENAKTRLDNCYNALRLAVIGNPDVMYSLSQTGGMLGRAFGTTEYNTLETLANLPVTDLPDRSGEFISLIKKAYKQGDKGIPKVIEQKITDFEEALKIYVKAAKVSTA